ncbi:MAG: response regulator [Acidobacteria bacterium]|jgi:CheY-like chemotaxis protein|nr:response regulator [Acidobacteriota bacterium]
MNEKKVLLIDDEVSLQRSLSLGLLQKGYETESCESGMCGLKALERIKNKQAPFQYVVVDLRLPDIDGINLLKVIKFNYPELPVVVITGYGNETTEANARSEKADAYLEKPFTAEELSAILADIPLKKAAPEVATEEIAEPSGASSVSAYVLLNFSDTADLAAVYQDLYFMDQVLYCDAIKGDFDLALLLQAGTLADIRATVDNKIKTLPGVKEAVFLPVDPPQLPEGVANIIGTFDKALGREKGNPDAANNANFQKSASSYVFLEIEKDKLEQIYPTLYINDQVVSCDCSAGRYDIVLLMQGASFAEIDRNILAKIKPLDGVLRIKEMPIIKLFEM